MVKLDRRAALAGLGALLSHRAALAVPTPGWLIATQVVAGTLPRDLTLADLALEALIRSAGPATVDALLFAIMARDAQNIGDPFADPAVEDAARHYVEMLYSGDIPDEDGTVSNIGFHQALAWQVLRFTKPPSVCGPGFGWWAEPPATV
jgi:hypothetical protein